MTGVLLDYFMHLKKISFTLRSCRSKESAAVVATGILGSLLLGISDHLKVLGVEATPVG